MRGCGTVFELSEGDRQALASIERLANKYEFTAVQLRKAVAKCRAQQSTEGLDEMVAFSFNAQQFTPNYGGGGANLPPGRYKGVIVNSEGQNNDKNTGGFLALSLTPIEGPLAGQVHIDRLNLHHVNPKTVQIANEQLSAYCHVLGKFQFGDTAELHNIPFLFEIGWQKGQEPSEANPNGGYTEVKAIADINGNPPGKAGAGPAVIAAPAATVAPPAGVAATAAPAAGWGGTAAPAPAEAPAAAPAPAAGWGAPAPASAPAPAAAPWGGAGGASAAGPAPWGQQG